MKSAFPSNVIYEFVTLFVMLNPFSKIPIFLAETQDLSASQSIRVAAYAVGFSFIILLFFIFAGPELLSLLEISPPEFELSGSLILLIFGIQMILGEVTETNGTKDSSLVQRAIFPLAIPTIAGPGAILTVVILADRSVHSPQNHFSTMIVIAFLLFLTFISFVFSRRISNIIGQGGIELITRVLGLLLSTIAVRGMVNSLKIIFDLS
jgi:multiple antibiotic resistance protein